MSDLATQYARYCMKKTHQPEVRNFARIEKRFEQLADLHDIAAEDWQELVAIGYDLLEEIRRLRNS